MTIAGVKFCTFLQVGGYPPGRSPYCDNGTPATRPAANRGQDPERSSRVALIPGPVFMAHASKRVQTTSRLKRHPLGTFRGVSLQSKFANNDNCETDLGDCLFVCASAQRTHCREHTGDMKRGDCAHTQRMHTRHTRLPSAIAGAILPPDVMFHFAHSCSCAKGTQFYDAQSGMQDDMTAAAYPPRAGMRLLWSKVGTRADTDRMHSSVVG